MCAYSGAHTETHTGTHALTSVVLVSLDLTVLQGLCVWPPLKVVEGGGTWRRYNLVGGSKDLGHVLGGDLSLPVLLCLCFLLMKSPLLKELFAKANRFEPYGPELYLQNCDLGLAMTGQRLP